MAKGKLTMTSDGVAIRHTPLGNKIWNYRGYYLMFLPVLLFVFIIYYLPMIGIGYAFYDVKITIKGVTLGNCVGFDNFVQLFGDKYREDFLRAFKNTLELSVIKLIITTFAAVIVSVFLNEMNNIFAKKTIQTIIYLPHFMSWAITASIFLMILSTDTNTSMVNGMLKSMNMDPINFLNSTDMWRGTFYFINIWKETGWGTIIFLATLSGINPELYEAADIDGATRMQKVWNVTVPALTNTIITVLILNLAKVMNLFESVFVLQTDATKEVSQVISTYIYDLGLSSGNPKGYGLSTAVGLFKSLVGGALVLICNELSKKARGRGIV